MSLFKFSSRHAVTYPIFGTLKDFVESQLPTYEDVIRYYLDVRRSMGLESGMKKEPTFTAIADVVAGKIEALYEKASIPIVSHTRVIQMLNVYHTKYTKLMNELRQLNRCPGLQNKADEFRTATRKLFDLASCKCSDFDICKCPKEKKVSPYSRT